MKTTLTAVLLALAALSSTVLADQKFELTDSQMDKITAGAGGCGDGECLVGAVDRADAGLSYGLHDVGTFCEGNECYSYSVSTGSSGFDNPFGVLGTGGRFIFGSYTCTGGGGVGVGGGSGGHGTQNC
jgi:hypothetical protein